MELLAPAGGWDSMVAAVQNGADAVYLGGGAFNARRYANNFGSYEEMQRALDYCHIRGVAVHVTMNTLLLDRELPQAMEYASFLYEAGADALIVQDLGFIGLLRQQLPDVTLHASTQMAIHNLQGLQACKRLGMQRVVLARELSLVEIAYLHSNSEMPLECFAQGALCTAVSGMCLFSSLAGGRSGNRGACAQPCRKPYDVICPKKVKENAYALSLGDLCMLFHIDDMRKAGVCSIKLEGRMKRPEYVAAVTKAYRAALDGADQNTLEKDLAVMNRIFSRGDGSTGYYYNASGVRPNCRGSLSDNTSPLAQMRETYQGERRKTPIAGQLYIKVGQCPAFRLYTNGAEGIAYGDAPVEAANKAPDLQRYRMQLEKMGDTPFILSQCDIEMETPAFLSIAALNQLRREAVTNLEQKLAMRHRRQIRNNKQEHREENEQAIQLPPVRSAILAMVPDLARALAAFQAGADEVALAPNCYRAEDVLPALEQLQSWRNAGKHLLLVLPGVMLHHQEQKTIAVILGSGLVDGGIAQNIGQLALLDNCKIKIAGPLCNAANRNTLDMLKNLGADRTLLSLELTRPQLRDIIKKGSAGIYAYGRVMLMQLWHCPVKNQVGCQNCGTSPGTLRDETGRLFPLDAVHQQGGCLVRVRNCEVLDVLDLLNELPNPDCVALEFFDEPEQVLRERVQAAKAALAGEKVERVGTTRGHWNRGWDGMKP